MSTWTQPDRAELDQLQRLAARREVRAYFFDHLDNPEWVQPLADHGFFDAPPGRVRDEEQGSVRFPPWPEGRYLIRMASIVPDAVAAVLGAQRPSNNPSVTRIRLQGAQALPDNHLRQLAPTVVQWLGVRLESRFGDDFAVEAAAIIARLARLGETESSLKAAKALLALERESDPLVLDIDGEAVTLRSKPVSQLSERNYGRATEAILSDLVDAAGPDGLRLFASLLHDALRMSNRDNDPNDEAGYSYIWRPSIADHPQNTDDGLSSVLVSAARDAALRHAQTSEIALGETVDQLERRTILHRRISLHVLSQVRSGVQLAAERVADRSLFDDFRVVHEYAELLRGRYGDLPPETRQRYVDWVLAGPDIDEFRQILTARNESAPSTEDEEAYAANWQRDRLSYVTGQLPEDIETLYRQHVERFGEAEHPDFPSWSSSWSGPASPVTKDEMKTWSLARVVSYLEAWRPDDGGGHFGASMEDLGRVLEEVVAGRAAEFADIADEVASLDPTYVRKYLSGLEAAVKAEVSISWDSVLRLMASVVEHPFEDDMKVPQRDRDPGWRWTRRQVASLLNMGMAEGDNRIPFASRNAVWQILEPLTDDPNPTPPYEASNLDSMGPFTFAINTNRGTAIRAAVAYALWCRRELEAQGADVTAGFDLFPEARQVLERHLQPENDPSIAIRAAYGERIALLAFLDQRWVASRVNEIFPSSPALTDLRDAAWNAYICWCPPYDSLFEVLQQEYEAAVERVPSVGNRDLSHTEQADQKLGEHLVTFYWRGRAQRSLLDRWFEIADDELAGHSMDFIGRALRNTQGDIDQVVLQRIRDLWDARIAVIRDEPEAHLREASAFASTFVSSKLDEDWSLSGLEVAVKSDGPRWLGQDVIRRLARIAAYRPTIATHLTLRILQNATNQWDHIGWQEQVADILRATTGASDDETIEHRSAIVDHYAARGFHEFRDHLRPVSP